MRLEHEPTARLDLVAVIAMVLTVLAIVWARIEVFGTGDIEAALTGEASAPAKACTLHAEVVRNRSLAGFTQ